MPTRSPSLEVLRAVGALALLGLAFSTSVHAHGEAAEVLPTEPGLRLGLSAAVAHIDASQMLPSNRMAGYLLQGDPGIDRRGGALEHAVLDVGGRLNHTWGAALAVKSRSSARR
jgi:hypothetical protein